MNNAFPILNLPPKVLTNVLQCMDYVDVWSLSFVSKRTKSLTVSLGRNVYHFALVVSNILQVLIIFGDPWKSLRFNLSQANRNLQAPLAIVQNVKVKYGLARTQHWRKAGYRIRDWIDHFMSVTNRSKLDQIRFDANQEHICNRSIRNEIEGLNIETFQISQNCTTRHSQSILETFIETFTPRCWKGINFPGPMPNAIHKYFLQNFDELIFYSKLSINDLAIMNSKIIRLFTSREDWLTIFNKFIKLWKTGSVSRLEYMRIMLSDNLIINQDVNIILKGVKHVVIDPNQRRYVRTQGGVEVISGGYDIHGFDGRKATIYLRLQSCEIIVWAL